MNVFKKIGNFCLKVGRKSVEFVRKQADKVAVATGLYTVAASASAAVPAGVTTALTDLQADAVSVATTFLIAIIAVKAIHMMRKA